MSDIVTLTVQPRAETGSRATARLRKKGLLPAVIYGHKEAVAHVAVDAEALDRAVRVQHARTLTVVLDGKSETVLIRELQWDHLGKEMIHADFWRVSASDKVKVLVPVELRGVPKTTGGGVLEQPLHQVHVECAATAIPDAIRVDIVGLTLGHPVHVSDLPVPAGVTILEPAEAVVVQLKLPGAEAVAAEAGAAEPEVLTAKKPKEGEDEAK